MLGTSLKSLAASLAIGVHLCIAWASSPCLLPPASRDLHLERKQPHTVHYSCLDETTGVLIHLGTSLCFHNRWVPPVPEGCWVRESKGIPLRGVLKRLKRDPNVGKFESLKRQESVQRKIIEGLLETYIDPNTPRVVRVHPGSRAFLLCRVHNLGTDSVMWYFGDKVLSIDHSIFIPDERYSQSLEADTGTWIMEIKKVRPHDEGDYTCQVTTKPSMKRVVTLQVIPRGLPLLPPTARFRHKKNVNRKSWPPLVLTVSLTIWCLTKY